MKKLRSLQMVCVVVLFCAATAIASPAQILTTLYSFCPQDLPELTALTLRPGLYKRPTATSTGQPTSAGPATTVAAVAMAAARSSKSPPAAR